MRLIAPTEAPIVKLADIHGKPIVVGTGRPMLLAFFRDAACPFCNMRIFELTQNHKNLEAMGLDIVAVFASTPEEVKRFVLQRPRPFKVAAEPNRAAYEIYGIQSSFLRKLKAMVMRFGTMIRGMRIVGLHALRSNNIMPADFLIDEKGSIVEAYYGSDAGDHIPIERIELFLARGLAKRGVRN